MKGKLRRSVTAFAILLMMFLVGISPPFVHTSRPFHQHSRVVADEMLADDTKAQQEWNRREGVVDESAREVPTGPDPLHHNNKPARP